MTPTVGLRCMVPIVSRDIWFADIAINLCVFVFSVFSRVSFVFVCVLCVRPVFFVFFRFLVVRPVALHIQ